MGFFNEWISAFYQVFANLFSSASIKACIAFFAAWVSIIFDLAHPSIQFIIVLMIIDFVLGAAIAIKNGTFSRHGIQRGAAKFVGYGLTLLITQIMDRGFGLENLFLNFSGGLCMWLIICEGLSSLRHVNALGPNIVPGWLFQKMEQLKARIENGDGGRNDKN